MMSSQVVKYEVDDAGTVVSFEVAPVEGFVPASPGAIAGSVVAAIEPAVAAARLLLGRVRELAPESVEVKFGVKVTGTANWLVAKAATEGNFEVTLSWSPRRRPVAQDAGESE
jgi:outer membrane lipoprotein SlyB